MTQQNQPLNPLEKWLLARANAGKELPPNLPVREVVSKWANYIQRSPENARFYTIERNFGAEVAWEITTIDLTLPMPTIFTGITAREHLILADDLKKLKSPQYALEDYAIYEQSLNALVGPSGAGKSFVAVDVCGRLAKAGASIVYVAAEGLFGYSSRWEAWKAHYGLKSAPNFRFWDTSVNFMDADALKAFQERIAPLKPTMVVVDTVARAMAGGDENSTKDMGTFVASCDRLREELHCGLLLVHHTGKDGRIRGSSALFAACDSVLFLQRAERAITIYNSLDQGGKNKYSAEAFPLYLQLLPRTASVDGKVFESAVLVPSAKIDTQTTDKPSTNERLILEALEGHERGLRWAIVRDATNIPESSFGRALKKCISRKWVDEGLDSTYTITQEGRDRLLSL